MVARVAVVVVAIVVVAWLALMERDTRLQASGVAAANGPRTPSAVARAEADLRSARTLNPDTTPDLARAVLYQAVGRRGAAQAVLDDILRREPDNLTAWGVLYTVGLHHDRATVRRALAAQRRLDPVSARRR